MTFEEAIMKLIGHLPNADETGKAVAEKLADAIGMELVEKCEPLERKIDGEKFIGWNLSFDGLSVWDGLGNNEITPIDRTVSKSQANLIVNAPDTMRHNVDLVNEWDERRELHPPEWLRRAINLLREDVIHSGFGCDLKQ